MSVFTYRLKPIFQPCFSLLTLLAITLVSAASAFAQSATTDIQVSGNVAQGSVHRLGVNLGDQTYWDSGQMMKNLIFENPGFEGLKFRTILKCAHNNTANSCQDDNQYSRQQTGFWKGGTYEIMSGNSAGVTGTVVQSTQSATSCSGCGQTVQFDQNTNLAIGDYYAVSNYFPGKGDSGWWDNVSGGGTITTETNDLSPNTPGKQAILLSAPTGKSVTIAQYFESFKGLSFIQLNGTFQLTFRAKGVGGTNQLSVSVQRLQGSNPAYLSQKVALTNAWKDYTLTFSANETGSAVGTVQLVFGAAGSSVELDDVALQQTNSDPTNTTVFRDDVVKALRELNPGTLRMMAAGAALGSDIPNQLSPVYARYRSSFSSTKTSVSTIAYGIDEFLHLSATIGSDPWITIPTATTPDEMTDLILYLTGDGSDKYSAIRVANGQSKPWTTVFNKIHIELGNETWNGDFKGESMAYPGYPQWANRVFGTARAMSGFLASKFDLILDGWAAVPGYNQGLLYWSKQHDSIDIAPYLMFSANDEPQATMFGAMLAEPEMLESPGGKVYQDMQQVLTAPTKTYMNVYETNLGTMLGNITQAELDQLTPSIGAGLTHTLHMLLMMRLGVQYQNAFALQQYQFLRSDQKNVRMWGMVVDMGTTNRRRPQFLTQAMANTAIGGNMVTTVHTGANPTWNQPKSSDSVILSGAHFLHSFAFVNGATASIVVFNLNQTTALPVTFSGVHAPTGAVQMSQTSAGNITDNNEFANNVQVATQSLSGFNPAQGLSLPPFSMTVLTWTAAQTQMPQFSVAPGTYTSAQNVALTSATPGAAIYYTTDGSTPTTASTKYAGSIAINKSQTVQAIAAVVSSLSGSGVSAASVQTSSVASAAYVIQQVAAPPIISLASGTYTSAQIVTISDALAGATIYYTTDGSTPTSSSNVYTGALTVSTNQTVSAIAVASNYVNSAVASAVYTMAIPAAAPVFSVPVGTYTQAQTVQITAATAGASVYYTTDGSVPTASSSLYVAPINVTANTAINAIAMAKGFSCSSVVTAAYKIAYPAATPVLSVAGGIYNSTQTVTITSTTANGTIYYTIDGSVPTTSSFVYMGPVSISASHTLQANAIAPDYSVSATASASYNLTAVVPAISLASGTYTGTQTVGIAGTTDGASYFYTTDGSNPTTASNLYAGPIQIKASQTLQVIATKTGYTSSATSSASYTIITVASKPVFSLAGGAYPTIQVVAIADAMANATIYYTTDGSMPTTASNVYAGPITIAATTNLNAIAMVSGLTHSDAVSVVYVIPPPAAAPTFSLAAGSYLGSQTVILSDVSAGATIYYTTDGTIPTAASTVYEGAITVNASQTVLAIAAGANYLPSAVASVNYQITQVASAISAPNGFAKGQLRMNGSTAIVDGALRLTNGGTAQAGSAWLPGAVAVNNFISEFAFQLPTSDADGFTFTIQNAKKAYYSLGGNGDGLGYQGITKSVTVAFNLYQSGVSDAQSVGVYTGGVSPQGHAIDLKGSGVDLHSGHAFHVRMVYSGATLTLLLTDKATGAVVTEAFAIDIPSTVGAGTAYVGFTGSTGGRTAVQNILSWTYAD